MQRLDVPRKLTLRSRFSYRRVSHKVHGCVTSLPDFVRLITEAVGFRLDIGIVAHRLSLSWITCQEMSESAPQPSSYYNSIKANAWPTTLLV